MRLENWANCRPTAPPPSPARHCATGPPSVRFSVSLSGRRHSGGRSSASPGGLPGDSPSLSERTSLPPRSLASLRAPCTYIYRVIFARGTSLLLAGARRRRGRAPTSQNARLAGGRQARGWGGYSAPTCHAAADSPGPRGGRTPRPAGARSLSLSLSLGTRAVHPRRRAVGAAPQPGSSPSPRAACSQCPRGERVPAAAGRRSRAAAGPVGPGRGDFWSVCDPQADEARAAGGPGRHVRSKCR